MRSPASCSGVKVFGTGEIVKETGWNPPGGDALSWNDNFIGGEVGSYTQLLTLLKIHSYHIAISLRSRRREMHCIVHREDRTKA